MYKRQFLKKKLYAAGIARIEIERAVNKISVNIHTAKPGIVIGRGGTGVEAVKADLAKLTGKAVNVNIIEVKPVSYTHLWTLRHRAGALGARQRH